jgi:phospholipase C
MLSREPAYRKRRRLTTLLRSSIAGVALYPCVGQAQTATPIEHLVVIIQENETFDHYFGSYPNAANIPGETTWVGVPAPQFHPTDDTPSVNGLTAGLLTDNPTMATTGAQANPFRLPPMAAFTCDNNHGYTAEQQGINSGLVNNYPRATAGTSEGCLPDGSSVLGYYDGNTVTALWNYAQHYAMSDNHFGTNYGPTGPGHANIIAGNLHNGAILHNGPSNQVYVNPVDNSVTMIGDIDAYLDDCPAGGDLGGTAKPLPPVLEFTGRNVGDLLNANNITWGYFSGGFAPTTPAVLNADGSTAKPAVCGSSHFEHQLTINGRLFEVPNPTINFTTDIHVLAGDVPDSHVAPFQFYATTRNPHHLRPTSVQAIGKTDRANHQYDVSDFFSAFKAGNFPAVTFLKPAVYLWGHPGSSDPLMEQAWLVQVINTIQQSPNWANTAIIIAWDDSDGWYDHVVPPITSPSSTPDDALAGPGSCGTPAEGADQGRCGFGPRLPLVVISPWTKQNFVDHSVTDQSSILRFIEDNWHLGFIDGPQTPPVGTGSTDRKAGTLANMFDFDSRPNLHRLILDPLTGSVVSNNE